MKKLSLKDAIVLIRLVVTLACCTACATSIIVLSPLWSAIISGISLFCLAAVLTATEPYSWLVIVFYIMARNPIVESSKLGGSPLLTKKSLVEKH